MVEITLLIARPFILLVDIILLVDKMRKRHCKYKAILYLRSHCQLNKF